GTLALREAASDRSAHPGVGNIREHADFARRLGNCALCGCGFQTLDVPAHDASARTRTAHGTEVESLLACHSAHQRAREQALAWGGRFTSHRTDKRIWLGGRISIDCNSLHSVDREGLWRGNLDILLGVATAD